MRTGLECMSACGEGQATAQTAIFLEDSSQCAEAGVARVGINGRRTQGHETAGWAWPAGGEVLVCSASRQPPPSTRSR